MLVHTTGLKSRILGYISKGDIVPLVKTTDWNALKTYLIANDESKHASVITLSLKVPSRLFV